MTLVQSLQNYGLQLRGNARLTRQEIETYQFADSASTVKLVGNIGSSYWPFFSQSSEFQDGNPDPLDRWSRRVAGEIAEAHALQALFPFTGPPYYPFQQWASRAENLYQSPIGIMMHSNHGLWHSYRFALLCSDDSSQPMPEAVESPCISCSAKPCLHSCPVDAFSVDGYDVPRCAQYLNDNADAECHRHGCMARYSCPIATDKRYLDEQSQFHLKAFLNAR